VLDAPPKRARTVARLKLAEPARAPADDRARDEQVLFHRYQLYRDQAAREELVQRFLPLARRLARRYERGPEPLEDLVQVASLGLVNAIDRFDAGRGLGFSTFAVPTILGELKRYFRDSCWSLHVPRGMQERVLEMNAAVDSLSRELGRSPTSQQLADELDVSAEDVVEIIEAGAAYSTTSLDAPARSSESEEADLIGTLGETDDRLDLVEHGAALGRALRVLPERERRILFLRFAEGLTQAEIGQRIGISQMHVSRLIRRSLERIRVVAGANGSN
jgi:RNA polymerase sigma-B factor